MVVVDDCDVKFSVSRYEGLIIRDALDMLIDLTPDYLEAWNIAEMVERIEAILAIDDD